MSVQIEVLGPLRVLVDGSELRLGGRCNRAVLALLASNQGRPVSAERLVEEVWGESAPASAPASLQVAVSRLRKALEPGGSPRQRSLVVQRGPSGYHLHGVDLDARRFSEVANYSAVEEPEDALDAIDEALASWRGAPFEDLKDVPSLAAEAARLAEDHLRLVELRADALLRLGRAGEAQAMLAPVVVDHPFRERLWFLLALSLYRCDRQAEALETLRVLRAALVDELGVDPSASVRRLEEDMLAQSPCLVGPPHVSVVTGRVAVPGETAVPEEVTTVEVPRQRAGSDELSPAPGKPVPSAPHPTVVVGRAHELVQVEEALAGLGTHGRGGLLVVAGEAGIGKSVLVRELVRRAGERRLRVAVGRCHEAEVSPAYWPWLPVLGALAGDDVAPEVAALLGGECEVEVVHADAAALRTFDAAARVLSDCGERLVVVLEDVHWSDVSSLRMLTYVAEALRDRPVLLVVTVRHEATPRREVTETLAGLSRLGAHRLSLSALAAEDVGSLVRAVVGDVEPELVATLTRRGDGNPFFVLEMARLLAARAQLTAAAAQALVVPDGIADVLRLRFQRLSQQARETLSIAAVLGREFDAGLIATAAGRAVLDDLDEAMAAGVVRDGLAPGTGRFVHALTRETIYADLPTGQRIRHHAAVAGALVERLSGQEELVSEVAHHFAQAAPYLPELLDDAVDHSRRAAVSAERRGAFEEARDLWRQAVALDARESSSARRHVLLLGLAQLLMRLGEHEEMYALLDQALREARERGDHVRMAESATAFRSTSIWYGRLVGVEDPQLLAALEECLEHLEDLGLRARLLAHVGLEHYISWTDVDFHSLLREAIEVARSSGDPAVLRDCLAAMEMTLWGPGMYRQRMEFAREHLALGLPPELEIVALFQLGSALYHAGQAQEADETMARAFALAESLGRTGVDVPLAFWRWFRATDAESPEAPALAVVARRLHAESGIVALAELDAAVQATELPPGDPVPESLVAFGTGHPYLGVRARVALAVQLSGDHELALEVLGEAEPLGTDYTALAGACLSLEVLIGSRVPVPAERIARAVEELRPHVDQVATYGTVFSVGSTAYFVGSGLLALGRAEEATRLLDQAVAVNTSIGVRAWERAARARRASLGD